MQLPLYSHTIRIQCMVATIALSISAPSRMGKICLRLDESLNQPKTQGQWPRMANAYESTPQYDALDRHC